MKQQLKKLILFLIATTFISCSLEEELIKNEQTKNNLIPIVKTVPYENAGETFRLLKNNFKIEPYLKSRFQSNLQARTTTQTSGLTIVTDVVKEVTLGDYTSYTMEVISQQDSLVFYNLTMEYKNGESSMFVTKYSPTEFWLNNKNESFQGNISSARLNLLTQYTDPEELFNDDLGNNNHDLGVGVGGGGGGGYSPQGSPYYPTDCGGIVIVSIEEVPYQCGCGDWPWQNCSGCNSNSPYYPGYHQIPYYICQDYGYGNNNPPSDTGGFNGGGPSNPSSGSDTSIAGMIKPEECTERITGDLNGDCMLSPYEACLLNGYSIEVCECINANNGTLADCQEESNCTYLQNLSTDTNFIAAMQDMKNKSTTLNKEVGYTQKADNNNPSGSSYDYVEGNDNTGEIIWTIPSATTLKGLFHTHYDVEEHLPVFSLDDMYALFQLFGPVFDVNGNVTFQNNFNMNYNFTFILVTAHGTKLALKFDNPESIEKLRLFGQKYFGDWEMDTSQMPQIPGITPETDRKKITDEYNKYVKERFDLEKQKKKFAEFLEELELGISLFQTNDSFTQWEKINKSGTPTPCN
ncbi:hypothetical protein [Flavobacterium sp.]|uniref:hypothetical protein n=3 Tax=Flavobacterium sp. TaxID=239 RepID=UPI00404744D3